MNLLNMIKFRAILYLGITFLPTVTFHPINMKVFLKPAHFRLEIYSTAIVRQPEIPLCNIVDSLLCFSGAIQCIATSTDGQLMCSCADDKSLKVFDVVNFGKVLIY